MKITSNSQYKNALVKIGKFDDSSMNQAIGLARERLSNFKNTLTVEVFFK